MEPVSNVDRLVVVLRQRLIEHARRTRAKTTSADAGKTLSAKINSLDALAVADEVDDRQLSRALIQSILADQLGTNLINEANFQRIVDEVTESLVTSPPTMRLMSRILDDLRNPPP